MSTADEEAKLSKDACVVEFVANAYSHLKSIAASASDSPLLAKAHVEPHDGVFMFDAMDGMTSAISQRFWQREARLRDST